MTVRVMLISPAMSRSLREARFEPGGGLDEAGRLAAREAAGALPGGGRRLTGPSPLCRDTALALGWDARPETALRDWDMGRWRGRRLDEVGADEPAAVTAWLTDPSAAPHGGESLQDLYARVGAWLDSLSAEGARSRVGEAEDGGRVLAVAGPALIRVAVVRALGLPVETFWRLDVAPLTVTELSGRAGRWNLRCGRPLTFRTPHQ